MKSSLIAIKDFIYLIIIGTFLVSLIAAFQEPPMEPLPICEGEYCCCSSVEFLKCENFTCPNGWVLEPDWMTTQGYARLNTISPSRLITQSFFSKLASGHCYRISVSMHNYVSGNLQVALMENTNVMILQNIAGNGLYNLPVDLRGKATQDKLRLNGSGQFDLDFVSINECKCP